MPDRLSEPDDWLAPYADQTQGASALDLVQRALTSNLELASARLEIDRAKARLRQAGLRPNPSVEFEQKSGRLTGSPGERETSVGVNVPLEIGGQRQARIDMAQAEMAAAEAEYAERERLLTADVRAAYIEAIAALRELQTTQEMNNLDVQTVHIVEARVTEGETAPLELSLLRVEVERLQARRQIVEGRLQVAVIRLKSLAGIPAAETLRLKEELSTLSLPEPLGTLDAAIEIALRTRPDVRFARLNERVAAAGLQLARTQALPNISAFGRYSNTHTVFDNTPIGVLQDRDNTLAFGISIGIPVFNRNQGAKAEATTAIAQARLRRESIERIARSEVESAYRRYQAARAATATFEKGVIVRSEENLRSLRGAYELGAYRVSEVLAEQRRLVDTQREYTEMLAERYRAWSNLQTALGLTVGTQEK